MNNTGTTPGDEPESASHPKNMPKQPGMPDRGRFVLAAFKPVCGVPAEVYRKYLLKRVTADELYNLMLKNYLIPGMIFLQPFTDLRMICRYEDEWRAQIIRMFNIGSPWANEWWPLN